MAARNSCHFHSGQPGYEWLPIKRSPFIPGRGAVDFLSKISVGEAFPPTRGSDGHEHSEQRREGRLAGCYLLSGNIPRHR